MRKPIAAVGFVFCAALHIPSTVLATNGDTLFGVGPTSRAMGGVGVAVPRDAISAIFANPAVMCDSSYCDGSQAILSTTIFSPSVSSRVVPQGGPSLEATSKTGTSIIPAIGITSPLSHDVRFGVGAYGISGMGVDYRDSDLGLYTQLQVMKFAPCLAATIAPGVSVGAALHVVYGSLDMGRGASENYTVGGQMGIIAHQGPFTAGLNYTLPAKVNHKRVADLDNDGSLDSLALESPQSLSAGLAFTSGKFLVEADVKWYDWSTADGYGDFGWHDQTVYAVGAEYRDWHNLTFRLGYNYGKSPVRERNGFIAGDTTVIQGKVVDNARLEYLRVVGFPAIAEEHFTGGISWQINERFQAHAGFTYSPARSIEEQDAAGTTISSEMRQRSYEIGLSWNFF